MRSRQSIRSFNRLSAWGFVAPAPLILFNAINVAFFCADLAECHRRSKSEKSERAEEETKCAPGSHVSRCTPGLSIDCPCDAIRRGYQVCNSDGTWDPCDCSVCGDGRVDEGEECDPGKYGFNDYYGGCKQDCTLAAHCGDGVLDKYNEECEIGNAGITAEECRNCTLVRCGDGYVDSGEECDNGDYSNHGYYGGCTQDCRFAARCGDGFVDVIYEECDDGLNNSDVLPGACRTDCKKARCGDGIVDDGETCDMGNRTVACKVGELDCTVCGTSCQNVPGVIFQALPFPVTDAEYSRALNRIVAINNATSSLVIYDPFNNNLTNVELDNLPTSVSVGPTGEQAAVGHEFSVTLVDLVQGTIVSNWFLSVSISDVVLANNGFIYAFPVYDDAIYSLEIATSNMTRSTGNTIGPNTTAKLHPDGTKIYGVRTNYYPSSLERYDITKGTAENVYSSHEGYDSCKDLWISQDGSRIFTACGNVFASSDTRSTDQYSDPYPRTSTQDMQYIETLPLSRIVHLDHHQRGEGVAVAIESFVDPYYTPDPSISQRLHIFSNGQSGYDANKSTYSLDKVIGIPNYRTERSEFGANGKFVFFSSDGLNLITVVEVESGAGLYHDFVLVLPAEI